MFDIALFKSHSVLFVVCPCFEDTMAPASQLETARHALCSHYYSLLNVLHV